MKKAAEAEGGIYREAGGDYFDKRNPERTARKLSKRLERIGYTVALVPRPLRPANDAMGGD